MPPESAAYRDARSSAGADEVKGTGSPHVHAQAISCESGTIHTITENDEIACRNPRISEVGAKLHHAGRKRRMVGRKSRKNTRSEYTRQLVRRHHPGAAKEAHCRLPWDSRHNTVD